MLINYHLQQPSKDVVFVPITLNYDRVHDGESFPMELLGEQAQRDNIYKIVQHFLSFNQPLGRVIIKYCEPLSLAQFISTYSAKNGLKYGDYQRD